MKKKIALLGSTGSIGTQALEVIKNYSEYFDVEILTANNNLDLLVSQAIEFKPAIVIISNEDKYDKLNTILANSGIKVYAGKDAINQVVGMESIDIVLSAMVGFAGLIPTIEAIKSGKQIALANKETLVVAGELISKLCIKNKVQIIPVDSEHSAIFQCIVGEYGNKIEKIYLTASGGPFRGKDIHFLENVGREEALKHPNWNMGEKITIDSATLMNKGLEVIEAKWLFDLSPKQIDVIIHPQSVIHSIVQFEDGSMKAQMGLPDMKLPILYALFYPNRVKSDFTRFNFNEYPNLTFEQPDYKIFRNLALSFEVLKKGGNCSCVLNAANEIVVQAFLEERLGFVEMTEIIEKTLNKIPYIKNPGLNDLISSDREAREMAKTLL